MKNSGKHKSLDAKLFYDRATWNRGQKLAHNKSLTFHIFNEPLDDEVWSCDASVQGSGRYIYDLALTLEKPDRRAFRQESTSHHLMAECSCPVGFFCKHSVAVLIELKLASVNWPSQIFLSAESSPEPQLLQAPRFVSEASDTNLFKTNSGFSDGSLDYVLKKFVSRVPANAPDASTRRPTAKIGYHMALGKDWESVFVQLNAGKTNIKKNGEEGATQLYKEAWPHINYNNRIDHFTVKDSEWASLFSRQERASGGGVKLHPQSTRNSVLELIESETVYWHNDLGSPVFGGKPVSVAKEPLRVELKWKADDKLQTRYLLTLIKSEPETKTEEPIAYLPMDPPLVVDTAAAIIAEPIGLPDFGQTEHLLNLGPLKRSDLQLFLDKLHLSKVPGIENIPPLPAVEDATHIQAEPQPTLILKGRQPKRNYYSLQDAFSFPYGEVQFTYDDRQLGQSVSVYAHESRATLHWQSGGRQYACKRNADKEQAHLQTLIDLGMAGESFGRQKNAKFGLVPDSELLPLLTFGMDNIDEETYRELVLAWADFYLDRETKDQLKAKGWEIEFHKSFPQPMSDLSTATPNAEIIQRKDQPGWFDYSVQLELDGNAFDIGAILPDLLANVDPALFLQDNDGAIFDALPSVIFTPDGTLVALDWPAIVPLIRPLMAWVAGGGSNKDRSLTTTDLVALSTLYDPNQPCPLSLPDGFDKLNELIRHKTDDLVPVPSTIRADLRPYQHEGLDWLLRLYKVGFGGILADDMGLGKTLQCISLVAQHQQAKENRPVLIIAPKSVVPNWLAEFEKFAPELNVISHQGSDRANQLDELSSKLMGVSALISSYPVLTRDKEMLSEIEFSCLILDEAQAIKNPAAKVTLAAASIQRDACFALSGTPVQNNLGELWSLANITNPGLLRDMKSFNTTFRSPIEKKGKQGQQDLLNAKLRPFLLRRDKTKIAAELPEKIVTDVIIEMDDKQKTIYEAIRVTMNKNVREAIAKRGLARSRIQILEALLRLRQVCCDPGLLADSDAMPAKALKGVKSVKLDRLEELLEEMLTAKRRILIFSQFTSMLDRIATVLHNRNWPHLRLDGKSQNRGELVKQFQTSDIPIFLISLKAGGVGLNLTAADTVIHFDPWWNPAVEDQATDRVYRIGQDKSVFVYRLLIKGSVEEAINLMQLKKRELAKALFDEKSDRPLALSQTDIDLLLKPIDQ